MNSKLLKGLVVTVVGVALVVLVMLPVRSLADQWTRLWPLALLALLTGTRTVRLPLLRVQATAIHPLVLIAVGALGPAAAVLTGLCGVAGAAVGRRWPTLLHFGFNSGALVLAAASASAAFSVAGGTDGGSLAALVWPLFAANLAFFVVNTGLVSVAVSLERRCGIIKAWRGSLSWTVASYMAGFSFAVGVLAVLDVTVLWAIVVAIPPCWLLIVFYRMLSEQPAYGEGPPCG